MSTISKRWPELSASGLLVLALAWTAVGAHHYWSLNQALIGALEKDDPQVVQSLLRRGANPICRSRNSGVNALIYLANYGETEAVKELLERGADVNGRSRLGVTALMAAAASARVETVKLLLRQGADATLQDPAGRDAAYYVWHNTSGIGIYQDGGFVRPPRRLAENVVPAIS